MCSPSSVWLRKCFHGCALLVFVPGLLLDAEFLSFATSLAAFLFIVAEVSVSIYSTDHSLLHRILIEDLLLTFKTP